MMSQCCVCSLFDVKHFQNLTLSPLTPFYLPQPSKPSTANKSQLDIPSCFAALKMLMYIFLTHPPSLRLHSMSDLRCGILTKTRRREPSEGIEVERQHFRAKVIQS